MLLRLHVVLTRFIAKLEIIFTMQRKKYYKFIEQFCTYFVMSVALRTYFLILTFFRTYTYSKIYLIINDKFITQFKNLD